MRKNKFLHLSLNTILFITVISFTPTSGESRIAENSIDKKSVDCLAKNIYFEARGEDYQEKIMVANVTINRMKSDKFPKTICKIIYQKKQFSWTKYKFHKIEYYINKNEQELTAWKQSKEIALLAVQGVLPDKTYGASHYHNHKVNPRWARKLFMTVSTAGHKWYRLNK